MNKLTRKLNLIYPPEKVNTGSWERIISLLTGIGLGYTAFRTFKKGGYGLIAPAGLLVWRGITGDSPVNRALKRDSTEDVPPLKVSRTITILTDKATAYHYWRHLEHLPLFMKHVKKVDRLSQDKYHWKVEIKGQTYSWNADITQDEPEKTISWKSVPPADIYNEGSVEFKDAPGNRGVEVRVNITYHAAKTTIGKIFLSRLNPVLAQKIKEDIRKFKRMVEMGQLPQLQPQPKGS